MSDSGAETRVPPPTVIALWRRARPQVRRQLVALVHAGIDIDRAVVVVGEAPDAGEPLVRVYAGGDEIPRVVTESRVFREYLALMPPNSIALITMDSEGRGMGISTCGRVRRDRP